MARHRAAPIAYDNDRTQHIVQQIYFCSFQQFCSHGSAAMQNLEWERGSSFVYVGKGKRNFLYFRLSLHLTQQWPFYSLLHKRVITKCIHACISFCNEEFWRNIEWRHKKNGILANRSCWIGNCERLFVNLSLVDIRSTKSQNEC